MSSNLTNRLGRSLRRYTGDEIQLYTDLSVDECVRRLRTDFSKPGIHIPRETVSDRKLGGKLHGRKFMVFHHNAYLETDSRRQYRSLYGELRPFGEGTRLTGRYSYDPEGLIEVAHAAVFGMIAAVILVFLILRAGPDTWLVAGIIALVAGGAFYHLRGLRAAIVADRRADPAEVARSRTLAEREYIVHYLQRLLDADTQDA